MGTYEDIRNILNRIDGVNAPVQEDAGLTDEQKKGLQAIYKKYGNYEGYGNGDSLPIGNMEQVIDPGSTLWADDKEYKELDAYMKKMGYDGFSDAQDKDEDFFDNAMKEMPISSAMQDDISKVLGNDYYQKPDLAKAAKDYMSSSDESTSEDSGELSRLKELSGIEEDAGLTDEQKKGLEAIAKKYSGRKGVNGDPLIRGWITARTDSGVTSDGWDSKEVEAWEKRTGKELSDWSPEDDKQFISRSEISRDMEDELLKVMGDDDFFNKPIAGEVLDFLDDLSESYQPFPEGDEFDIEEDGEQALANDLALFFAKRSKELLQSMERPDKNDQEYEEFVDIAQAFKKGIQAGLDEVNMSDFEFSNNPFGDFGRGIDDGPDEELVDILNQHGYQPGPDGANDKATIVKQKEESADSGELGRLKELSGIREGHYPHIKSFDKLYGINDMQQYKAMADDAQSMDMGEFMDTYSSVIDMAGDFWEDHQKTSESNEDVVNEDPNTLAKELASEIMRYVRKGFDHIPADALKAKAKEYLSSIKESAVKEDAGLTDQQKQGLKTVYEKYKNRKGYNGDVLPIGYLDYNVDTGIWFDGADEKEVEAAMKKLGHADMDAWEEAAEGEEYEQFLELAPITGQMIGDLSDVLGDNFTSNDALMKAALAYMNSIDESYEPFPEADEFDINEDEDFEEVLGPLGFPEDELWEAEYRGRKVPLNKPMRGDVKKFKVYVKDPKSGNIKKVNFGHGGTSAKKLGQKTMKIRKCNPKARKSFRARHNCANPGPKTKARYWSCRKW